MWNFSTLTSLPTCCDGMRLSRDETPGIVVDDFLARYEADTIVRRIAEVGIDYYIGDDKSGTVVKKGKLGPNYFRYRSEPDVYWREVECFTPIFRDRILQGTQTLPRLMDLIGRLFGQPAEVAHHDGRSMMACTVRDLPGAPIHRDFIAGETDRLSFASRVIDQFAWNIYLKKGAGGETVVYRAQGPGAVDEHVERARIDPSVGSLVIFRSTNAHEVRPAEGERLTLSGFFGPTRDGQLLFWV